MKQSVRSVVLISCMNVIIFTMPKLNSLAILLLKNSFSRMCVCVRARMHIYIYVHMSTYALMLTHQTRALRASAGMMSHS